MVCNQIISEVHSFCPNEGSDGVTHGADVGEKVTYASLQDSYSQSPRLAPNQT